MMESLVQEFADVGLIILGSVFCVLLVRWLDRNIFNKGRKK